MKKIAVLGAAGFLGSSICSGLEKEHKVVKITRKEIDLLSSKEVSDWLEKEKFDVIVNCAIVGGNAKINDVSFDDIKENVGVFLNFYNNSEKFGRFLNIGSGAEFDMSDHIILTKEIDILQSSPKSAYGLSKNIISRICLEKQNFFTLRLFGCFASNEPNFRILQRMLQQEIVTVENKKFDFFSFKDFYSVLKYYIIEADLIYKDINCVYSQKYDLLEILEMFKKIHNLKTEIRVLNKRGLDYTGDGTLLSTLPIELEGLIAGLEKYI